MPIFALANTVIQINLNSVQLSSSLSLGILLGLVLGKTIGITIFSYVMHGLKIATLPIGINFISFVAASILCGIGFTMSIFISTLAFKTIEIQNQAKIAVLLASLIAGIVGYCLMVVATKKSNLA